MKYLFSLLFILFFINGCTRSATPQSHDEVNAKKMIKSNITDAERARSEYLALQAKRKKESSL
jgi:F0F1-type ATP synthase membrane subunit b/b'